MKNWHAILGLATLLLFPMSANTESVEQMISSAQSVASTDAPSDSGYLCCAIAIDSSQTGLLLKIVAAFIGIASGCMLFFKIWEGYKEVRQKETRRALSWVHGFILEELLLTVDSPTSSKKGDKKEPRLVQRELITPLIKLLGEFVESVQSNDEGAIDRLRGQLGQARSKLEKEAWTPPPTPAQDTILLCLYNGEDDTPPPKGKNWRFAGDSGSKEPKEYFRELCTNNPRIAHVMVYDIVYGDWTTRHTREQILGE